MDERIRFLNSRGLKCQELELLIQVLFRLELI